MNTVLRKLLSEVVRGGICQRGVAALEFAMVLPLMMIMFFGLVEGADALTAERRVTRAVNSLADLAAQSNGQITAAQAASLFVGVEEMLEPTNLGTVDFRLISVELQNSAPVVHWSINNNGGEPYTEGAAYNTLDDSSILTSDASLIVVELTYEHKTTFVNRIFADTITFNRRATRWPRLGAKVNYCDASNVCTS